MAGESFWLTQLMGMAIAVPLAVHPFTAAMASFGWRRLFRRESERRLAAPPGLESHAIDPAAFRASGLLELLLRAHPESDLKLANEAQIAWFLDQSGGALHLAKIVARVGSARFDGLVASFPVGAAGLRLDLAAVARDLRDVPGVHEVWTRLHEGVAYVAVNPDPSLYWIAAYRRERFEELGGPILSAIRERVRREVAALPDRAPVRGTRSNLIADPRHERADRVLRRLLKYGGASVCALTLIIGMYDRLTDRPVLLGHSLLTRFTAPKPGTSVSFAPAPVLTRPLTSVVVDEVVRGQAVDLHECARIARGQPGSAGTLLLDLVIQPDGRVSSASRGEPSTVTDRRLTECILDSAKYWVFPSPGGETDTRVAYPLALPAKAGA